MIRRSTILICGLAILAAASDADARNRLLRFALQEPIPEGTTPAEGDGRMAPRLSSTDKQFLRSLKIAFED